MNQYALFTIAAIGGVLLAMQGALNAKLGIWLRNPLYASLAAFFFSTLFALMFIVVSLKNTPPSVSDIKQVPPHMWFTGALCSVVGVTLYYYTIPKLGISTMISLGLFGQLLFSVIAGHYGWLNLPVEPVTLKRVLGVIAMIIGIALINFK